MKAKLTDSFARSAETGRYFDQHKDAPRGFLLDVTPAGARSWRLNYRVKGTGRERRMTIGDVASWSVADAREAAAKYRRLIDAGADPLGQAEAERAAPTVQQLVERYVAEVMPKRAKSTRREYQAMLDDYILPALGNLKVTAVSGSDVDRLHRKVTDLGYRRRANAVITLARALFGQAVRWKERSDNPAVGIERNREEGRARYLSEAEIARLLAVLEAQRATCPDGADMVKLLLLTGARRGEVIAMTWDQLDLDDAGTWTKPAAMVKQRRLHRVPLSSEAIALLQRRRAERAARRVQQGAVVSLRGDDPVFPGVSVAAMATRVERDWRRIRAAAGLDDVRLHDLRHSFASLLVGSGLSLPIIGALLGHSQAHTTQRYAHLADDPLRRATAVVGAIVGKNGNGKNGNGSA